MSQQIYTDDSFTQNGFKSEYYNTRNLTGELFQAAIEPAIDYAWKIRCTVRRHAGRSVFCPLDGSLQG